MEKNEQKRERILDFMVGFRHGLAIAKSNLFELQDQGLDISITYPLLLSLMRETDRMLLKFGEERVKWELKGEEKK